MYTAEKAALFAGALLLMAGTAANAQSFGKFYFFGDSLTDCCVFGPLINAPNGGSVKASNWAAQLPPLIGASYTPNVQNNLAIGGATSGYYNGMPVVDAFYGAPTGLLAQIGRFSMPVTSKDIAGIWVGTNDILPPALAATPPSLYSPLGVRPGVAALADFVAGNVRSSISALAAEGIRSVVLVSPYDVSRSVAFASFGASDPATLSLASQYSIAIRNQFASLYTPGVNTYFFDTLTLLNRVQADPAQYGFSHYLSADNCSATPACANAPLAVQNTYVFNDPIHLTSGFDGLMARYIANIINAREAFSAPGDISQGAGLAFSNSLIDRLDSQRRAATSGPFDAQAAYMPVKAAPGAVGAPAEKFSVFVEGAGAAISRAGGPTLVGPANSDINTSFAGITIGADYQAALNLRVGGAFNFLNSSTDLPGLSKTHVDSNSFQGGLFASLSYPHFFLDGAATYGLSQLDTKRPGVIDTINGSLDGNTFTFAGRGGYLFDVGAAKMGPIAEIAYSNVRLGSYAERGDDLLTLGVNAQNFDGLTGGAGGQLRTSVPFARGSFNPFINLTAQHDFIGAARTITSFSTDAPLLLINTTGGRPSSDLYGKVSGGFDAKLGNGFKGILTVSSTFGRSGGNDYSWNGGLQYQF